MLGNSISNEHRSDPAVAAAARTVTRCIGIIGVLLGVLAIGAVANAAPALTIIDVNAMPWNPSAKGMAGRSRTKTVFQTENNGRVVYYYFPPTWDTELHPAGSPGNPARTHFHLHHEWGYVLFGDYILHEAVSPYQRNPSVFRYVEGTWLSRPAYSLHSGDWATGGFRSQNPSGMILLEEGDTSTTLLPDGKLRTGSSKTRQSSTSTASPTEWDKKIFPHPWIVNSGSQMEWETDSQVEGRLVKWLSDDPALGFRAQLVKVPPGWTPPANSRRTYFEKAHRIRYVLYGDMRVLSSDDPGTPDKVVTLGKDYFIYQPPHSVWAYGEGPVTESGAVWLEVTYAKGLALGGGPIEVPKTAR